MTVVRSDRSLCQGYTNCIMAAPDYFDLGDDGIVILLSRSGSVGSDRAEVADRDHDRVESAVKSCPVSALRMENE